MINWSHKKKIDPPPALKRWEVDVNVGKSTWLIKMVNGEEYTMTTYGCTFPDTTPYDHGYIIQGCTIDSTMCPPFSDSELVKADCGSRLNNNQYISYKLIKTVDHFVKQTKLSKDDDYKVIHN